LVISYKSYRHPTYYFGYSAKKLGELISATATIIPKTISISPPGKIDVISVTKIVSPLPKKKKNLF